MEQPEKRRSRAGKRKVMLSIDPEVLDAIDLAAVKQGLTRSAYIEVVLRAALRESPFPK